MNHHRHHHLQANACTSCEMAKVTKGWTKWYFKRNILFKLMELLCAHNTRVLDPYLHFYRRDSKSIGFVGISLFHSVEEWRSEWLIYAISYPIAPTHEGVCVLNLDRMRKCVCHARHESTKRKKIDIHVFMALSATDTQLSFISKVDSFGVRSWISIHPFPSFSFANVC